MPKYSLTDARKDAPLYGRAFVLSALFGGIAAGAVALAKTQDKIVTRDTIAVRNANVIIPASSLTQQPTR